MKKNTLVVSLTVLLAASPASPATTNVPTTGELTPLQAQTDYDTLRKALEEAHPGLYRHSTETEMNRRFEAHRALLNRPMSRIDFIGIVSEMLAGIRCGHTGLALDPETQAALTKAPLFPLRLAVENRRLVVMFNDTPDDTTIRPGMEITEINGRTADAILDLLLSKLTTDGYIETGKRWRLAQNFGRNYWLFVDRSADFTIKARHAAGEIVTAKLAGVLGANRTRNQNPVNATMLANAAKFEGAPGNVALRFVDDPAIAHLRIRGFGGSDYPPSVENAFRTLTEKGAKVLILDLRGNGGGNDLYGAMLVSYLRDQPFRYFDHIDQKTPVPSFANWRPAQEERARNNVAPNPAGGYFVTSSGHQGILEQPPGKFPFPGKVIVLMDGRTFSTAADVCATLHHLKRATFVGEESGGGYCGNTSGLSARVVLPNSQLSVGIPMWGYWNAVAATADKHRGTLPDHPVETRVADLLGGVDAPWGKALQLATGLAAQETKSSAPVVAADHLELQGDEIGEVTQHDAMMLSAHVPRLVNRLKQSGRTMPAEVDALLTTAQAAFRNNEHYRAFRLYARAAGLAQGADQIEAHEVAASFDLALNRAIFAAGDTINLTLQPLFSLGHPLAGRYTATAWLETRTGAIAGTEQKLAITELKPCRFDFAVDGLVDGVTAVGYRLSSAAGETLVEFRHAVLVAQDAQRRGEQLSTRFGAVKQSGGAAPLPAVASALETIAHHLQAMEQERTRFDGNWQRAAHPLGMYLNVLNNTTDGNPPHRFPVFAGRLRYPEDIVLAETLVEALAASDEARLRPTGDLTLAYRAGTGGELVRYRIFVPAGYDPARKYSLIVALHSGAGEGSYFEWETYSDAPGSQENQFKKLAQERGCIVACPNGRGNFQNRRGETDVLDVAARVQAVYSIDPARVFLTGWSLGSNAVWRIGLKYPERFRAIAPVAGAATWINRENTTKAAGLPVLFSVAEQDFDIEPARRTAALAKDLLRNFAYTEYPATSHPGVWSKALPAVLAFFDACGAGFPSVTRTATPQTAP